MKKENVISQNIKIYTIAYVLFIFIYFIGLFFNTEKLCTFGIISSSLGLGVLIGLPIIHRKKIGSNLPLFILILISISSILAFVIVDGISRDKTILTILGSLSVLLFCASLYTLKGIIGVNDEMKNVPKNKKLLSFTFISVLIVLVTSISLVVSGIIPIKGNYTVYITIILQVFLLIVIAVFVLLKRR